MFNRITAVVLFVNSFTTSLEFYRDILGLQVVQLEAKFAAFRMNDQNFAIIAHSEAAEMVNVGLDILTTQSGAVGKALLCVQVENVDVAYETLSAKGVPFTQAPVDQYWGLRTAFFQDPDGNIWEIAHPIAAA